jgi:hypothetical protein
MRKRERGRGGNPIRTPRACVRKAPIRTGAGDTGMSTFWWPESRAIQRRSTGNRHHLPTARRLRSNFLASQATVPNRDSDYPITGWGFRDMSARGQGTRQSGLDAKNRQCGIVDGLTVVAPMWGLRELLVNRATCVPSGRELGNGG